MSPLTTLASQAEVHPPHRRAPLDLPPFRPHPLFRGGHAQTVAGCYLPWRRIAYRAVQHLVPLPDEDKIVLHDDCPEDWKAGDPVVLMVHGLGGCHQSGYMQRGMIKLTHLGIRVFRMDLRGCGAGFSHARHTIHAGRSEDAAAALAYVIGLCPQSPVHMAAYSMGANIALKMAGEFGDQPPPELASLMAVAPPIDLVACSQSIQLGWNRLYDQSFVVGLLRHLRRRAAQVPNAITRQFNPRPRRLIDFDNQFTAPLAGFATALAYYEGASSAPLLRRIAVPTLIVAAASDPIVPIEPFERATYSDTTELVVTPCGGHLGFVGQSGDDPDRRWIDWRLIEWVTSHAPQRAPAPFHARPTAHAVPAASAFTESTSSR
ncbi:MAG: alpha/beta fold hydrolase [Pirellulaceae bacterium]